MLNLTKKLFLSYLLLKPFYLFSSGGLQFGDFFLLASFVLICIVSATNKENRKILSRITKEHRLFALFVVSAIIINSLYFIMYPEVKFVLSSLYFVFNLIAVITFSVFLKDKVFLRRVGNVFKFNLLLQLIIWAIGLGRHYSPDRYMGTFNDPNQFGYYVLLSFLFIFLITSILKTKNLNIYYALALFLVFLSGSTGMLLGMAVFSIGYAVYYMRQRLNKPYSLVKDIVYIITISTLLLLLSGLNLASGSSNTNTNNHDSIKLPIIERADEKISRANGSSEATLWEDRGLDTIANNPWYLIYGSGEGAFGRFAAGTKKFVVEIHSTFPGIMFYYGALPTFILLFWIYKQLKNTGFTEIVLCIALFTTSFTLLNQRQSLFWILIVLAGASPLLKDKFNPRKKKDLYAK